MTEGIFRQPARSVLTDLDEFYFGYLPWLHSRQLNDDRSRITVVMSNPAEDDLTDTITCELSAADVKNAVTTAMQSGSYLCCLSDIVSDQLGAGCAQDLDIILQTACYGRIAFA